jgi:hypothetical protein
MGPIKPIRLALDLALGLLVELRHARHPQDHGVRLRLPVERPFQLMVGINKDGLNQHRLQNGLAAAGGCGESHCLRMLAAGEIARGNAFIAQLVQGFLLV